MMIAHRSRQRGQELVEYALALPLFLLLVMGILDIGRATYYYSSIHNSAREGARYGVVHSLNEEPVHLVPLARLAVQGGHPVGLALLQTSAQ